MEPEKIGEQLKSLGMFEVWHEVEKFDCYREVGGQGTVTVTVRVMEQVASSDRRPRYMIDAIGDNGKRATGNPQDRIDLAISLTHWGDLDK